MALSRSLGPARSYLDQPVKRAGVGEARGHGHVGGGSAGERAAAGCRSRRSRVPRRADACPCQRHGAQVGDRQQSDDDDAEVVKAAGWTDGAATGFVPRPPVREGSGSGRFSAMVDKNR